MQTAEDYNLLFFMFSCIFVAILVAVYHLHGIKNAINRQTEWMMECDGGEEEEELGGDPIS